MNFIKFLATITVTTTMAITLFPLSVAGSITDHVADHVAEIGCEPVVPEPCRSIFATKSTIEFYGWALTGITVNNHGGTNEYGNPGPYAYNRSITPQSGNSYVLMLEQPSDWKLNQLWVGAKKELNNHFGWGFRADFNFGTDSRYPRFWGDESFDYNWGSGDYYASFVTLNATLGTKNLNLKVGKFGGGFSYESLAAPYEFFYSHANIAYGRPMTVSGAMVESTWNNQWTVSAAWTAGVFNSFDNSFGDNGFLGKITRHFNKSSALTYKIFYNNKGGNFRSYDSATDILNTLIFTWKINNRWFYMIEGAITNGKVYDKTGTIGNNSSSDSWGINQHLICTINEKLSAGLRIEFLHARGTVFDSPSVTGGQGGNLFETTFAINYKINPKIMFRPELRYDHTNYKNNYRPFGKETHNNQLVGSLSFVVIF
ncbi:MAG: porin [Planctomycetaceae bacterium]|jgi:hypothetical protein|nr:porin [Planctomycetaceae bacterium]